VVTAEPHLSRKVYLARDAQDAERVATFLTTNGVKAWPVLKEVSAPVEALDSFWCSVAVPANEVHRAHELLSTLLVLPREGDVPDEEIERELRDPDSDQPFTK
jgi:hypothetical protein